MKVAISPKKNKKLLISYEIAMAVLALIVVALLLIEYLIPLTDEQARLLTNIDFSILAVFAIDYFYRLFRAKSKWQFVKSNVFDLIAIMPFDKAFRVARLARLVRLVRFTRFTRLSRMLRMVIFLRKFGTTVKGVLKTNGLIYIILATFLIVVGGAFGILELEPDINTFGDALWWSLVTTTTVGYGDLSPSSAGGRILAAFLMLVGIGFIGMVTGSIATFFVDRLSKKEAHSVFSEQVDYLKGKLDNLEHLSYEDIQAMQNLTLELWKQKHQ